MKKIHKIIFLMVLFFSFIVSTMAFNIDNAKLYMIRDNNDTNVKFEVTDYNDGITVTVGNTDGNTMGANPDLTRIGFITFLENNELTNVLLELENGSYLRDIKIFPNGKFIAVGTVINGLTLEDNVTYIGTSEKAYDINGLIVIGDIKTKAIEKYIIVGGNNIDELKYVEIGPNGTFIAAGVAQSTDLPVSLGSSSNVGTSKLFVVTGDINKADVVNTYEMVTADKNTAFSQFEFQLKTSDSGNFVIVSRYNGSDIPEVLTGSVTNIYEYSNNNLVTVGNTNVGVLKVAEYGGSEYEENKVLKVIDNNTFIMAGYSGSSDLVGVEAALTGGSASAFNANAYIAKVNFDLTEVTTYFYGGTSNDHINHLDFNSSGEFIALGVTSSVEIEGKKNTDFEPYIITGNISDLTTVNHKVLENKYYANRKIIVTDNEAYLIAVHDSSDNIDYVNDNFTSQNQGTLVAELDLKGNIKTTYLYGDTDDLAPENAILTNNHLYIVGSTMAVPAGINDYGSSGYILDINLYEETNPNTADINTQFYIVVITTTSIILALTVIGYKISESKKSQI